MAGYNQTLSRLRSRVFVVGFAAALSVALTLTFAGADASQFPDGAEAILIGASASHDGFPMKIDDNGFSNPGGNITEARMYCVQATVLYRCGIGDDETLRVQGNLDDADLSAAEGNQLAWMLSHRSGYSDAELQNAIWCISNPGAMPALAKGTELCNAARAAAVPDAPTLTLATLGSGTASAGSAVHFTLATNAPSVDLTVSDGGPGASLCGSAPDNAAATISGNQLVQNNPATQRTFELCLVRDNIASTSTTTLHAALGATNANVQIWKHPSAPRNCQGLIDSQLTASRISTSSTASWDPLDGWLTVQKSVVGDVADGTTFTIELSNSSGVVATHSLPDTDDAPWSHTFTGLTPGEYVVTESVTGGATRVTVTPGGPIVVASDAGTIVNIVNEFVGKLRLTKRTDIPVDETFSFTVECEYGQAAVGDWENPILLASGESFLTPELPAGTICSIDESDSGSAQSTFIATDALGVQTQTVGTQSGDIVVRSGITVDVGFTNNFAQATTSTTARPTTTSTGGGGSTTTLGATTSTDSGTVGSLGSTTSTSNTSTLVETGADSDELAVIAGATSLIGGALVLVTYRRRRLRSSQ